jgi:hypothetical protein
MSSVCVKKENANPMQQASTAVNYWMGVKLQKNILHFLALAKTLYMKISISHACGQGGQDWMPHFISSHRSTADAVICCMALSRIAR